MAGQRLTKENLKNYYPYPYEICTRKFMDNVAMNQDPKYAYGVVLPFVMSTSHSNSVFYFQYAIDGSDYLTMCYVKPSIGGMMLAGSLTGKAGTRILPLKRWPNSRANQRSKEVNLIF